MQYQYPKFQIQTKLGLQKMKYNCIFGNLAELRYLLLLHHNLIRLRPGIPVSQQILSPVCFFTYPTHGRMKLNLCWTRQRGKKQSQCTKLGSSALRRKESIRLILSKLVSSAAICYVHASEALS